MSVQGSGAAAAAGKYVRHAMVIAVVAALIVGPRESGEGAPSPADVPETAERGSVTVRRVLLVINDDGSATVSADLRNVTAVDRTLTGVVVEADGRNPSVARTLMDLPVPRRLGARVGDASDAGGFVVPHGVRPGATATVRFHLDDGTSITQPANVVRRGNEHDMIFPTDGTQLGPVHRGSGGSEPTRRAADADSLRP